MSEYPIEDLRVAASREYPELRSAGRQRTLTDELNEIAPVVGWDYFIGYIFDWHQDQHVGLIGPTDTGKSNLTYQILPLRQYVTFFGTKPRDKTLDKFAQSGGFTRIRDWPPVKGKGPLKRELTAEEMPKRLLWPEVRSLRSGAQKQREVFEAAIDDIYAQGCWCVVWDEFWYICQLLGLEKEARLFLQQARSNNISFVMGSQRPSRIPLEVFDQSTHLFFSRDNDERNLERISGIGWLASDPIKRLVASLSKHEFLYINTREGWMYRVTAPLA